MRPLVLVGMLLVVVGGALLIGGRPVRIVMRALTGARIPDHPAARIAAWGLVLIGLAVIMLGRAVA